MIRVTLCPVGKSTFSYTDFPEEFSYWSDDGILFVSDEKNKMMAIYNRDQWDTARRVYEADPKD